MDLEKNKKIQELSFYVKKKLFVRSFVVYFIIYTYWFFNRFVNDHQISNPVLVWDKVSIQSIALFRFTAETWLVFAPALFIWHLGLLRLGVVSLLSANRVKVRIYLNKHQVINWFIKKLLFRLCIANIKQRFEKNRPTYNTLKTYRANTTLKGHVHDFGQTLNGIYIKPIVTKNMARALFT